MSTVALDRLLAVLVVAMATTGLLSLRAGSPEGAWLFLLHGLLGGSLLAAVVLKLARSVPAAARAQRWGRLALGLLLGAVALAALGGGFTWVASGQILWLGPWTLITLHAVVGLVLVPLVLFHLLPRRWRLLRPRSLRRPLLRHPSGLSRRSLIATGLFALAAAAGWGGANLAERLRGGDRRFTGSRWLPSGGVPPPTTFFGEPVPTIDAAAWRLTVRGRVQRPASYTLDDLRALGETERTAVLDCTGGWAMETGWRGLPLRTLLDDVGASAGTEIVVRSVTGWSAAVRGSDVDRTLLATGVAGGELPIANGAPLRLVVPERRGLDWVKWVSEVEVT